jgi:hypothetical protein
MVPGRIIGGDRHESAVLDAADVEHPVVLEHAKRDTVIAAARGGRILTFVERAGEGPRRAGVTRPADRA